MCDPIFDVINYYILGCHMGMMIIRVYDKIEIETRKREKMTIIELFYMDFYPNCVLGLEFTQTDARVSACHIPDSTHVAPLRLTHSNRDHKLGHAKNI